MEFYTEISFSKVKPEDYSVIKVPRWSFMTDSGIRFKHEKSEFHLDIFHMNCSLAGLTLFGPSSYNPSYNEEEFKEVSHKIAKQLMPYGVNIGESKEKFGNWPQGYLDMSLIHFKPKHFKKDVLPYFAENFEDVSAEGKILCLTKKAAKLYEDLKEHSNEKYNIDLGMIIDASFLDFMQQRLIKSNYGLKDMAIAVSKFLYKRDMIGYANLETFDNDGNVMG